MFKTPLINIVVEATSYLVDGIEKLNADKIERLDAGCKIEVARDAINIAGGGASIISYPIPDLKCGELYVRGAASATSSDGSIHVFGGKFIKVCSPIVLDLGNDGFQYTPATTPIITDESGNGRLEKRAWIGPNEGILIYDHNSNNQADHDEWVLTNFSQTGRTDLEALRAFDSNSDGVFNAADASFGQFRIGRDLNQDAQFGNGELFTMQQLGISAINLFHGVQRVAWPSSPSETAPGIFTFNTGNFVRSDGSLGAFQDVALQINRSYSSLVYEDSSATIVSYGAANAFLWGQGASQPIYFDLAAGANYAGFGNFVDVVGGGGSDHLLGNDAANNLFGGAGADHLHGRGGNDFIFADYEDMVSGSVGGGEGNDLLQITSEYGLYIDAVSLGFETVISGSGSDYIVSSVASYDYANPTAGQMIFFGGAGNDTLVGGEGNDLLVGDAGSDVISGAGGNDVIYVDLEDNLANISGGWGYDTLMIEGGGGIYVSNLYSLGFETAHGGDHNDTLYASRSDNRYYEQKVDNVLSGGKGNDYLYGGAGADTYVWALGDGSDTFVDKDYGETKGDIIDLVAVSRDQVSLRWGTNPAIVISGEGGGTIALRGFGLSGPRDMLHVDGKWYDLTGYWQRDFGGPIDTPLTSIYPLFSDGQNVGSGTGGSGGGGSGGGGSGGG
ncbi:calcium-binding protein, partial [Sphingomonas sp. CCH5-D11]|uniref:calcium-binding protein n=1 Tax=Sphingomonas sp. CCH5-D11 TaxID=1768786 RepID=UPI0022B23A51